MNGKHVFFLEMNKWSACDIVGNDWNTAEFCCKLLEYC